MAICDITGPTEVSLSVNSLPLLYKRYAFKFYIIFYCSFVNLLTNKYGKTCYQIKQAKQHILSMKNSSFKQSLLCLIDSLLRELELKVMNLDFDNISISLLITLNVIFKEAFEFDFHWQATEGKELNQLTRSEYFQNIYWNSIESLINNWICTNNIVFDEYCDVFYTSSTTHQSIINASESFVTNVPNAQLFYQVGQWKRIFKLPNQLIPLTSFSEYKNEITKYHSIISTASFSIIKCRIEKILNVINKYAFFQSSFQLAFHLYNSFSPSFLLNAILDFVDLEIGQFNNFIISTKPNSIINGNIYFDYFSDEYLVFKLVLSEEERLIFSNDLLDSINEIFNILSKLNITERLVHLKMKEHNEGSVIEGFILKNIINQLKEYFYFLFLTYKLIPIDDDLVNLESARLGIEGTVEKLKEKICNSNVKRFIKLLGCCTVEYFTNRKVEIEELQNESTTFFLLFV